MLTFNAKVRINGSALNEVRKFGLTAPEVILLREIHGEDAVLELERAKEIVREDIDERERLELIYGASKAGAKLIASLFGAKFQPLPKTVPGVNLADLPKAGVAPKKGTQRVSDAQVAGARDSLGGMAA